MKKKIYVNQEVSKILIGIASLVIILAGISASKAILVPFFLSIFIAIITMAPLSWLRKKGVPTWLAFILVIISVLFIVILFANLIGSSVKDFSNNMPAYELKFKQQVIVGTELLKKIGINITKLAITDMINMKSTIKFVTVLFNGLGNVLANICLIFMIVIFMLLESASFYIKLEKVAKLSKDSVHWLEKFVSDIKHYMAIKTIVSIITGIFVYILLVTCDIDYPFLWSFFAFIFNYIPNIGFIIATIPAVLLSVVEYGFLRAAIVLIGYIVIGVGLGNVIEPRLMGKGLGLSTLVVFLSLIFWGWLLGPAGMFLSVPLTITVKIALDNIEDMRWLGVLFDSK